MSTASTPCMKFRLFVEVSCLMLPASDVGIEPGRRNLMVCAGSKMADCRVGERAFQ